MKDDQAAVIAGQLRHALDLMQAEVNALQARQSHLAEMSHQRLNVLEKRADDQEARLRGATEGVTQFKVWSGLVAGSSGLMSLAALVRAFFGGTP